MLAVLLKAGLVKGKTLGLDATTLEANAAMRSIVRRDSGESYPEYLKRLAEEGGQPDASRSELARKDRTRKKKGSNKDWKHPHDPDVKITKMKDGRTHLAHKAEHVVDLESGAVVALTVQPADRGDTSSHEESLEEAAQNLAELLDEEDGAKLSEENLLKEVVADRGYHSNAVLETHRKVGIRSYIAEPKRPRRRWRGKKEAQKAVYANRRRLRGEGQKSAASLARREGRTQLRSLLRNRRHASSSSSRSRQYPKTSAGPHGSVQLGSRNASTSRIRHAAGARSPPSGPSFVPSGAPAGVLAPLFGLCALQSSKSLQSRVAERSRLSPPGGRLKSGKRTSATGC